MPNWATDQKKFEVADRMSSNKVLDPKAESEWISNVLEAVNSDVPDSVFTHLSIDKEDYLFLLGLSMTAGPKKGVPEVKQLYQTSIPADYSCMKPSVLGSMVEIFSSVQNSAMAAREAQRMTAPAASLASTGPATLSIKSSSKKRNNFSTHLHFLLGTAKNVATSSYALNLAISQHLDRDDIDEVHTDEEIELLTNLQSACVGTMAE